MANQDKNRISNLELRQRKLSSEIRRLKQMQIEAIKLRAKLPNETNSRRVSTEIKVAEELIKTLVGKVEQRYKELELISQQKEEIQSERKNSTIRTTVAILLIFGLLITPLLLGGMFGNLGSSEGSGIIGAISALASDHTKPTIDIDESSTVKSFGNVRLNFTVTDDVLVDSVWATLKDGGDTYEQESIEINSAASEVIYIVTVPTVGTKQVRVSANDSSGNVRQTNWVNIERLQEIPLEEFFGDDTSNLTEQNNAYEIENFTLENEYGKVKWRNKLNLVDQDVSNNVNILPGIVEVDSQNLEPSLNSTADIVLYNRSHTGTPTILKNESNQWSICTDCSNINYYPELNEVHFTVPSFSAYKSVDGSNLLIYDDSDTEGGLISRYAGQDVGFYANYSNSSTDPIIDPSAYCEISYNETGAWTTAKNMSYNSGSSLYEKTENYLDKGDYFYNISCYSDIDQNFSLIDNITLLNSVPSIPTLYSPTDSSNITNRTPELIWFNSTDADSLDSLTYRLHLSNSSDFTDLIINTSIAEAEAGNTSLLIIDDLNVGETYYWKVKVSDSEEDSSWSETFSIDLLSYIEVKLIVNSVNFGNLAPRDSVNTTNPSYTALEIANLGNVPINIDINATPFFYSDSEFPGNYSFMIAEKDIDAYLSAVTDWTNMSESEVQSIIELKHINGSNSANEAYLHLLVVVPNEESPGEKTSQITIVSSQS